MRTDDLLEQCLQALTSGQDLPPDLARYLATHPEQRAQVEDLLAIGQRVSRTPSAELSAESRSRMQIRLASRLGFDPSMLDAPAADAALAHESTDEHAHARKKPLLSIGRVSLAKLRYQPPGPAEEDPSEARIREVFRDLTPEDIRRYIGVRGEAYLYYRQKLPGWEPVLTFVAFVLRSLKRIETLASDEW